jgi:hypothetical protein
MLEIVLRSAIILSRRRTLDGLLMGIAGERFGSQTTIDLPLLRQHDIVHASQMLVGIPDGLPMRPTTFIQSFVRTLTTEPELTAMLRRQPPASSMSHGSGPNSNIESVYMTLNVPAVYFLGVGDIARIRSLLMTLVHIGSQAHRGMGEVEHTNLIEVEADPTWFGVVGRYQDQSIVLRPVPLRLTHLLPPETYGFHNDETWDYPYFPGYPGAVVEPCLVPPIDSGNYFHREDVRRLCSQ